MSRTARCYDPAGVRPPSDVPAAALATRRSGAPPPNATPGRPIRGGYERALRMCRPLRRLMAS